MQLFTDLEKAFLTYANRNAFFINGSFFTYAYLARIISEIRFAVHTNTSASEKNIGLVANDDIYTYAAIFALWFEGKAYVPLGPETPKDRNDSIIQQAELTTIIDSSENSVYVNYKVIASQHLNNTPLHVTPKTCDNSESVYILFTSGTTGKPKGVPITRENLTGFVNAFWEIGFEIDETDRCLQMFDLTFDLSVMSYLIPLLKGACVYTIPKDKIKFSYIDELMDEQKLTFALMVPSMLHFLRPYFSEINAPAMRYSLFCGEALPLDVTQEWSNCLPNAEIFNVYGPTEDTIFCTHYLYSRTRENKSHNGVLSIGKPMEGTTTIIIDEHNNILPAGETGELCLGGVQLTPGYWKNEEKNKETFFMTSFNGKHERFYKTGDLCISDAAGDILYLGRIDFQTKIQGFRVELSEIEFHVKSFLKKTNVVALAITDVLGNKEIGLVIESGEIKTDSLIEFIKTQMPAYMIPKQIRFIDVFPLNSNGKTDRKKLELLFKNS